MTTVSRHYDEHLGPVYAWMLGGVDAAIRRGTQELDSLNLQPSPKAMAIDLGAGFGMHAIPLARQGYRVLAIDSCALLLGHLRKHAEGLPVIPILDDLLSYQTHLSQAPELILCLGDTLTHLPDNAAVESLIGNIARDLAPGGQLVLTFRDNTTALVGDQRFIQVKSDDTRILTCFLEVAETQVMVHDLLHERAGDTWQLKVSSYPKLRLSPEWVRQLLRDLGFVVTQSTTPSRMQQFIAQAD